jgi:hypothetical protein
MDGEAGGQRPGQGVVAPELVAMEARHPSRAADAELLVNGKAAAGGRAQQLCPRQQA